MSGQSIWIIFGVLSLGIFVGGNLGIMLMVILHMAKKADLLIEDLASAAVQSDDVDLRR